MSKQSDPIAEALTGITPSKCASACKPDRCVITERAFCGHPMKGALHERDKETATLERWQAARKRLAGGTINISST